jgi:hypothetical protein
MGFLGYLINKLANKFMFDTLKMIDGKIVKYF